MIAAELVEDGMAQRQMPCPDRRALGSAAH